MHDALRMFDSFLELEWIWLQTLHLCGLECGSGLICGARGAPVLEHFTRELIDLNEVLLEGVGMRLEVCQLLSLENVIDLSCTHSAGLGTIDQAGLSLGLCGLHVSSWYLC